ncbi:hypothetical protein Cfor_00058 [Coptotermes formosanus]|uniref:START domain-containing protein n=1 Tax=Coptotermes formosanus TaxID=36987 RepID=A0A6L2PPF2_COPFO|nr:hypothetical protein Cfor_00058 [Coptotermes formosanus]
MNIDEEIRGVAEAVVTSSTSSRQPTSYIHGCCLPVHNFAAVLWSTLYLPLLTTAGTCAFLIAKVFVYSWTSANQPVFQVLLVLISFVLSWGEAWFLDFRVLPQELQAMEYLQVASLYAEGERAPLLRNYLQGLQRMDNYTESVGSYYSPVDSPQSMFITEIIMVTVLWYVRATALQDMKYRQEGQDVLEVSWRILNSPDWKLEKETADGDRVYSKKMPVVGKVFKLTGIVGFPAHQLLHELFSKAENIPKWNPTILETRTIQSGKVLLLANLAVQGISTSSKYCRHRPVASFSCSQKSAYCAVMKIINRLPPNLRNMMNKRENLKVALKRFLFTPFTSLMKSLC